MIRMPKNLQERHNEGSLTSAWGSLNEDNVMLSLLDMFESAYL